MNLPWVVYTRVSTDEQADNGASLAMQRDQCRAMATALGHGDVEMLADDGYTGKDLKRPAMQQLLARVREGKLGGIIIWKLDRLTRRVRDLLHLVEQLGERNVALVSLHEKIDTSGPMGRFVLIIMGAVAQLEQETIAHRVKSTMSYIRSQGYWAGGRPPIGTRIIGPKGKRQLEVVPEHAAVVAEIFAGCVAGVGLNELARRLQASGAAKERPTATNLAAMLRRRRFVELGMVSAELFAAAGAAIEGRRPGTPGLPQAPRAQASRVWPLTGLARCGRCGAPIVGAYAQGRSNRYPYLRCTGRARKRCDLPDLPAEAWEAKAVEGVKRAIDTDDWRKAWATWCEGLMRDQAPADADHQRLTLARDKVAAKVGRLLDLVADGSAGAMTRETLVKLEAQVAEIDRHLHAAVGRQAASAILDQRRQFVEANLIHAAKALATAQPAQVGEIMRSAVAAVTLEVKPTPSMALELFEPGPAGDPGSYHLSRMVLRTGKQSEPGPQVRYGMVSVRVGQRYGLEWAENAGNSGLEALAGVSAGDLARRLGVSRRLAQRWKAGTAGSPARLRQVALALAGADCAR